MQDGTERADAAVAAAAWLRDAIETVDVGDKVAVTYNPLRYAWAPHEAFLRRFGATRKKALLVGMNPGPWGMAQNGIPFGTASVVKGWLGLDGHPVGQPDEVHPKRPVHGWACTRDEKSGERVWGFLRAMYGTPERALSELMIANHCPLLLYAESGANITPDKLRKAEREALFEVCDEGVRRIARALEPEVLIGVGAYAEERCAAIAEGTDWAVDRIPHPSPASPLANKDGGIHWRRAVAEVFVRHGLLDADIEVR